MLKILHVFLMLASLAYSSENSSQNEKKYSAFFELQFLTSENGGRTQFSTTTVPHIDLLYAIRNHSLLHRLNIEAILLDEELRRQAFEDYLQRIAPGTDEEVASEVITNTENLFQFIQLESDEARAQFLQYRYSNESFSKRIGLLSNFLAILKRNYDIQAVRGGENEYYNASDQEMLDAVYESIETGERVPAGVCRHMHQMAIRVAQEIGFDHAYGVSYRTLNGEGHLNLLVLPNSDQDGDAVQLNYGSAYIPDQQAGLAVLNQNHSIPETGIRFRVFNGNDELSIVLPTELGGILNRMSGGNDNDLGFEYDLDAEINQLGVNTPYGMVRFFKATTPTGNQQSTKGFAVNSKWFHFNDIFYGSTGVVGFSSSRDVFIDRVRTKGIYGRATLGHQWSFFTTGNLNLKTFSQTHLRGTYYCAGYDDCDSNGDYNIDTQYGVQADYKVFGLQTETQIARQTVVMLEGSDAIERKRPDLKNNAYSYSQQFSKNFNKNYLLEVGFRVTQYDLQDNQYSVFSTNYSFADKKRDFQLTLEHQQSLDNYAPFFLPGAVKSYEMQAVKYFGSDRDFTISGELELHPEYEELNYVGISLSGRLTVPNWLKKQMR